MIVYLVSATPDKRNEKERRSKVFATMEAADIFCDYCAINGIDYSIEELPLIGTESKGACDGGR